MSFEKSTVLWKSGMVYIKRGSGALLVVVWNLLFEVWSFELDRERGKALAKKKEKFFSKDWFN